MATPTPATENPKPRRARRQRARRAAFGSVRQLASGRYQVRYLDADGSRRTAPRTFESSREAEDWLATSRADLLRGTYHSPHVGAVALADYASEHVSARVDLSPRTLHTYTRLIRVWFTTDLPHPNGRRSINLGRMHLRDLTPAVVREWHTCALHTGRERAVALAAAKDRRRRTRALHAAREWARANGYDVAATGRLPQAVLEAWQAAGEPASATLHLPPTQPPASAGRTQVAQAYRLLSSVLNVAVQDGLLPANPCIIKGAGQVRAQERTPATAAEVSTIAQHMPERYTAAVHIAAWSGLRAGELFALTRSHVDLRAGSVRVDRALVHVPGEPLRFGPPKTPTSLRTVHLPAPVVDLLARHMATYTAPGPDALIFATEAGGPLHPGRRTTLFRAACAHVGRHDLRWHDLRHTGATLAAQAGASLRELQARLGHSTVDAAMRYQHATTERDREVAARMAALIPAEVNPASDGPAPLRAVT